MRAGSRTQGSRQGGQDCVSHSIPPEEAV
jgi:hypothetical protein